MCGPSRTVNRVGVRTSDWYNVGGGDGFQGRVDPEDPNIVYAQSQEGGMTRLDLRTGVSVGVHPRTNNTYGMSQADMDAEIRTNGRGGRGGEEQPAGAPPAGAAQPPAAPQRGALDVEARGGGGGRARRLDAGTGTRRSSSARTPRAGSTSAAIASIAATIAATRGRRSAAI